MKAKLILPLLMLVVSWGAVGQLPNFTISATSTAQTCLGNGSLAFMVNGIDPDAAMAYQIFLLPNTTTPVATVNTPAAPNLIAGNYMVIATQTLGAESNTATVNVTIQDELDPLEYTLSAGMACDGDGMITVNVISGNAVSYEIMTGPVTASPQNSNVFDDLLPGLYQVRVYDDCGDAVVVSVQIDDVQPNLIINTGQYMSQDCDTVLMMNYYGSNEGIINWPLTFMYTVYPPGGGVPETFTQEVTLGDNFANIIEAEIPYYEGSYYYNIQVTDACGNVYNKNNNVINASQFLSWDLVGQYDPCQPDEILLHNFVLIDAPITVSFLDAPAGFDPEYYNPNHPSFDVTYISYHQSGELIPPGEYTVMITDSCGREFTQTVMVPGENSGFHLEPLPGNCGNGGVTMCMAGKGVAVKEMIAGPEEFSDSYPVNLIGEIQENGDIDLTNLPPGDYTIHVVDECGYEHTVDFTIVSLPGFEPTIYQRPGCLEEYGSIKIQSGVYDMSEAYMIEAPAAYIAALPFNIIDKMAEDGSIYVNSLPEGDYKFAITTQCGIFIIDHTVIGYEVYANEYSITAHCGSFDLYLNHSSNNDNTYWLQKYDEETDAWVHPGTGEPDGILQLTNWSTTINLAYTGNFRIIKIYFSYGDGEMLQQCTETLQEFVFSGAPDILAAYSFPCEDNTAEVILVAEGIPPLNYSITTKNGQPFPVDNNQSPHFLDLETGLYNFQVTDDCGNIKNIVFDINTLDPLAIQPQGFCDGQDSSLLLPDFGFLTYEWWNEDTPGTILSTGNELLFPAFDPAQDTGTYFAHVTAITPGSCIDIVLEYEVTPNGLPDAGGDNSVSICNTGEDIDLSVYLTEGADTVGLWEDVSFTGLLNGSMLTASGIMPGTYQFLYTATSPCGLEDDAVITLEFKGQPETPIVDGVEPVCEGGAIQLSATAPQGAIYHWEGPNGFESSLQNPFLEKLTTAAAGTYAVFITMEGSECQSQSTAVEIEVNPVLQFTIEGNTMLCEEQTSVLTIMPVNFDLGAVTYEWYFDGELLANVTSGSIEVMETGQYEVFVSNTLCITSQIINVMPNTEGFELQTQNGCVDFDYMIAITNIDEIPGAVVLWTGPDGFTSSEAAIDISGLDAGDYIATVTNADGCNVEVILPVDNTMCDIPRGVSPNADGWNDFFDISNLDVQILTIFNRHGIKVYEAENYTNEWYGQSDKGDLPTGTYYYMITLSAGKQITGWVYLQREIN